jgi:hypothetical protein
VGYVGLVSIIMTIHQEDVERRIRDSFEGTDPYVPLGSEDNLNHTVWPLVWRSVEHGS